MVRKIIRATDKRAVELLVMSNSNRDMAPCWFYKIGNNGKD